MICEIRLDSCAIGTTCKFRFKNLQLMPAGQVAILWFGGSCKFCLKNLQLMLARQIRLLWGIECKLESAMCFLRATSDTQLCSSPKQEWMLCKNCSQKPHQSCKINSDFATWTTKRFQPVLVSPTPYNLNPKPFTFSLSTCLVWVCLFGLISIFYPFPSLQDQSNENVDKLWMVICFSFIGLKIQNGLQS